MTMRQRCARLAVGGVFVLLAACAAAADMAKTLRIAIPVAETGFDPQAMQDLYSDHVMRAVFEPLYAYEYLVRPYRIAPATAAGMPEIGDDGRTWTIKLRPGIHFADDPAFAGRKRELVAADYVYAWKRLIDPRMRSPYAWFLEGKLVGADPVVEHAKKTGRLDYDAPIEGLRALDRYTIRIGLKEPDFILQGYLTHTAMAAVAREVIEAHADASGWALANPVGTGPYMLKSWRRGQQIVLEANPGFRGETFPDSRDAADKPLVDAMRGKRLPAIGRIEIAVIEESNPRLLAFDSGALEYMNVPSELSDKMIEGDALRPAYRQRGITLERVTQPALQYAFFNMDDPVVGGYDRPQIALRRAIALGFDVAELSRVIYGSQAIVAAQPIPPNVAGHDDSVRLQAGPDLAGARSLLDRFGYIDRDGDGFRDGPDGKPLVVTMGSATSARDREFDEIWAKSMRALGIRLEFTKQKWPDLLKMARAGKLQMWRVGWIAQYAEGDAFLQQLYGKNVGASNLARFSRAEYDKLYVKSRTLPNGPERNAIYRRLQDIVAAYTPWVLNVYTIENTVVEPWVLGYKKHAYREHPFLYLDIDLARARSVAR